MTNSKFEYRNPKQIQMFQCSNIKTVEQNNRVIAIPPKRERRFVIASGARRSVIASGARRSVIASHFSLCHCDPAGRGNLIQ